MADNTGTVSVPATGAASRGPSAPPTSPPAGSPRTAVSPPKSPPAGNPRTAASPSAGSPGPTAETVPASTGFLEIDDAPDDDDADSLYSDGADGVSDTTSVMSAIYRYRERSGRTYHAFRDRTGTGTGASGDYAPYFMPNDESETERLDLQHNLCLMTQDGQFHISPAGKDKPMKRVLDAGTGTGIWAIEFADQHPETAVVGVDISPIQPDFWPPNVEFFVDDLEQDWNYVTHFDLVYLRLLTGSIKDWPKLFRQAYDNLNPGGYIEVMDISFPIVSDDGTHREDSALYKWDRLLIEATSKLGASLVSAKDYKQQLADAGFQNIVQVEYKWPLNPSWPRDIKYKEIGAWSQSNILDGLQGATLMSFTNALGWSPIEVEVLLAGVRKDIKNRDIHSYYPVFVVYAQKPE